MKKDELAVLPNEDRVRYKALDRTRRGILYGIKRAKGLQAGYGPAHDAEFKRQIVQGLRHLERTEAEIAELEMKARALIEQQEKGTPA